MDELKTDRELLREYTEGGSEGTFTMLVQRHLDLVFATALRGLNDTQAAQEVTQNVFITLARKAAWLCGETNLAGWLHKTTLFEVRHRWRGELRRQRREQTAVELGTLMKDEDSLLKALAGELDEGLLELRESDRQALMLRYFEGRSHREIGHLLGVREDAVRMRIGKALARLTQFFRHRGYAVPAVTVTATLLGAAAKAAPAGLAMVAAQAALAAGSGGSAGGLNLLLAKFMGLTKTQTGILCLTLTVAPVLWEWNANQASRTRTAAARSKLEELHHQEEQSSAELERLRAESARLDGALLDAETNQARYEAAARKLEALKARVRGLLTDANHHWPEDLPYARISKKIVKSLNPLEAAPGTFSSTGRITEQAQELFGITAQEKAPTEQALANYWRGVQDLMTANAYETNLPGAQTGRLTKTVVVPPLGQPLKDLAEQTRSQLAGILGAEREQLLFGGWDQGAIQVFWPGNLWQISDAPQTFTVWADPGAGDKAPRYGVGWHQGNSGMSTDSQAGGALSALPRGIATQFFAPWLGQFGATTPTRFYGDPDE